MKIDNLTPEQTILQELGRRLATIRKQKGFSQTRLAEAAGVGVATLRRIEAGNDSQIDSWLKLLKPLDMLASVDLLLPKNYRSPMAEVKASQKKRSGKQSSTAWGDEQRANKHQQ